MERLIEDANKLKAAQGEAANLTIDSYADVIEAIHTVQEEMNITGTTAKEGATTITGSIDTMKAAWQNLLAGMASPDANIKDLMDDLVESIGNVAHNLAPVIGNFISAFGELAQAGLDEFERWIGSSEGQTAAQNAAIKLGNWLEQNTEPLLKAGGQLALALAEGLLTSLWTFLQDSALDKSAGWLERMGFFSEAAYARDSTSMKEYFGKLKTDPEGKFVRNMYKTGEDGGKSFAEGVSGTYGESLGAGRKVASGTEDGLKISNRTGVIGSEGVAAYTQAIADGEGDASAAADTVSGAVSTGLQQYNSSASTWGADLIGNFIAGLNSKSTALDNAVGTLAKKVYAQLHFSEPDEGPLSDFHTYAPDMVELFAQGIKANKDKAKDAAWELADAVSEVLGNALNTSGIMKSMYGGLYDIWSKSYDIDNTEIRAAEDTLNSLQSMLKAQQGIVSEAEAARQQAIKAQEDVVEATRKAYDANVWNDSNLQAWEDAKALLEALKGSASADNTAKYGNNELYKTLIALQQENDLYDAINQKISEQKDAISALSESDDITKAKVQLQSLSKQYEKQNKSVAAANEAYAEILKQYGEGSEEAVEYRNKLIDEKSALQDITQQYNDLTDQINRYNDAMKTAASFAGSDYTSRLNFANSGLGTSTAALINATTTTEQNINLQADIVMDSTKVGEALYKPIINVFKNNGTTLSFAY